MEKAEIVKFLQQTPLFEGLPPVELDSFAARAGVRALKEGEWLFRQGDPSEALFVVAEGTLRVVVSDESAGLEKELGELTPGNHFGEVALLEGGERGASIQACADATLIELPREELIAAVKQRPELGLDLCRGLIRYIQVSKEAHLAVKFVNVEDYGNLAELAHLLPPRVALACKALVLERVGDRVKVGLVDPHDAAARDFVRDVLGRYRVEFAGIEKNAFLRASDRFIAPALGARVTLGDDQTVQYIDTDGLAEDFGDEAEGVILRDVLREAVNSGASDIHFEPGSEGNIIRMRLDGALFTARDAIQESQFRRLVARIKAMSDLDITNSRTPEDGRFMLTAGEDRVEVRVAATPCLGGQKLALRMVDPKQRQREVSSLFVSRAIEELARDVLLNPSGLALVVGPTGSGKTTTLYAALNALWEATKTINVLTIEDPVEYDLSFASQMQVNRQVGLDFETLLRSALRQDPDVILVGEVRDAESAAIATEASVTGHLVLSSLHSDSVLEAIVSMRRFGVQPHLLGASLRGVVSQRLLPRVCPECAAEPAMNEATLETAGKLGILPDGANLRRGEGCENCRFTGESGRVGVFELLAVNDALRTRIEEDAGITGMREVLDDNHFLSLQRYVRLLLKDGIVSPERAISLFPKFGTR